MLEGDVNVSFGLQAGVHGKLNGVLDASLEAGAFTHDIAGAKLDVANLSLTSNFGLDMTENNFVSGGVSITDNFGLAGSVNYSYLTANTMSGLKKDGPGSLDWSVTPLLGNFGPKNKTASENLVDTQGNAGVNAQSTGDGRKFYGLDIGAGAKLLLGIDISFKIGMKL